MASKQIDVNIYICVCVCVCVCAHLCVNACLDWLSCKLTLYYRIYVWQVTHFFGKSKKTLIPYISLFLFKLVLRKIPYHLH